MKAGWIKKHCAFLDETEYTKGSDYGRFMKALTNYKREGIMLMMMHRTDAPFLQSLPSQSD